MTAKNATATCRTEGCRNNGVPMPCEVHVDENGLYLVYCHPCGQQITDVVIHTD